MSPMREGHLAEILAFRAPAYCLPACNQEEPATLNGLGRRGLRVEGLRELNTEVMTQPAHVVDIHGARLVPRMHRHLIFHRCAANASSRDRAVDGRGA